MGLLNPWAWLGGVTLALPILAHWLRRERASRQAFPSLRFLAEARVVAVRRHRLNDLPLLGLRLCILALAVIALAQPIWPHAVAASSINRGLSRAVVFERSAAMNQFVAGAETGRRFGEDALAAMPVASRQIVVDADDMSAALVSARHWVLRQPGDQEIVLVSPFARGSLTSADIAAVPLGIGLRCVVVPVVPSADGPPTSASKKGASPHLTLSNDRTNVQWMSSGLGVLEPAIDWSVDPRDQSSLSAALAAANEVGVVEIPNGRNTARVVLRDAPDRLSAIAAAQPIDRPWMFDVIRALSEDPTLASTARGIDLGPAPLPVAFTPVVIGDRRQALVFAASLATQPMMRLLIVSDVDPGSVFIAALARELTRAMAPMDWEDLETSRIDPREIAEWQRPPAQNAAPIAGHADPFGRWLWVAVLVALLIETWWRRRVAAPRPTVAEVATRVA